MADLSAFDFTEEEEARPKLMRMIRQKFGDGDRKRQKKADEDWTPRAAIDRKNRPAGSVTSIGSRTRSKKNNANANANAASKGVLPVRSYKNVVELDDEATVSLSSDLEKPTRKSSVRGELEKPTSKTPVQVDLENENEVSEELELEEERTERVSNEEKRKKELEDERKKRESDEEKRRKLEDRRRKRMIEEAERTQRLLREALSMSRQHPLVYPRGDPDPVTITSNDIDMLRPSAFLNDTVIDFYIKHLQTRLSDEEKAKTYFFNSFFFPKLVDLSTLSPELSRAAFARLLKWTKDEDMFQKDYIFIPVNKSSHWSLIVICDLGDMLRTDGDDFRAISSRILHFDSFMGFHSDIEPFVRNYLQQEWKRRNPIEQESLLDQIRYERLTVPQQDNMYDCGVFVLHYVELFLERCFTSKTKTIPAGWFDPSAASAKRVEVLRLIHGMLSSELEVQAESVGNAGSSCSPLTSSPDDAEELVMFHGSSP